MNVYSSMHSHYINQIIQDEIDKGLIIKKNNFLYLLDTKIYVRDRYNSFPKVELEKVPTEEIELAAYYLIKYQYGIDEKELIKIISKSIGIKRMTQNVFNKILKKIEYIKNDEKIVFKNNKYFYIG